MKKYIKKNEIVGIFPEGRLDEKIRYPKTGAVRLSLETRTQILPIGIKSSYLPFSSKVVIGKSVKISRNKGMENRQRI